MIQQHARDIVAVMSRLAARQSSLSVAALAGAKRFEHGRHYPSNDAVDAVHGTEFYYHAHADGLRAFQEHGHFHVFVRTAKATRFHHLVGISLDSYGMPTRLFLTNQWVTGEAWVNARAIRPLLGRFACRASGRLAPVARWITAMVHVYAPQIEALHQQRDRWFAEQMQTIGDRHKVLQSRRHQVVAQQRVYLPRQLASMQ
jgi:hypothetical protein